MTGPLAAFLGTVPDLRAGNCQPGRSPLPPGAWDEDASPAEKDAATHLCRACPVLDRCSAWLASLPRPRRPGGIVAGRPSGWRYHAGRYPREGDRVSEGQSVSDGEPPRPGCRYPGTVPASCAEGCRAPRSCAG